MEISSWIKIGDRVKMTVGGKSYNTIVEGVTDEGDIYISPPLAHLKMLLPEPEQICSLHRTNNKGLVLFDARVLGIEYSDNIPLIKVTPVSEPRKVQRRMSYRTDIMLDVTIRKTGGAELQQDEDSVYDTKTLNISEDGMLFISDIDYQLGEMIECDINLNRFDMNDKLEGVKAEVTRCEKTDDGRLKVAVQFTEYSRKSKNLLLRFIIFSQRKKNG